MYSIVCSNYLAQQEYTHRVASNEAAAASRNVFIQRRGIFGVLLALVGGGGVLRRHERLRRQALRQLAFEHQREAEHWAAGRAGEEFLAGALARQLDDRYVLLRNYTPPAPWRSGGDIDAVLLGPHGVTVFEVKALSGEYRCEGQTWYWRPHRGGWSAAMVNPSEQALENAQRVRGVLRRAHLEHVRVRPIVAVSSPEMSVELAPPLAVYIYFACRPQAQIGDVLGYGQEMGDELTAPMLQHVYAALMERASA